MRTDFHRCPNCGQTFQALLDDVCSPHFICPQCNKKLGKDFCEKAITFRFQIEGLSLLMRLKDEQNNFDLSDDDIDLILSKDKYSSEVFANEIINRNIGRKISDKRTFFVAVDNAFISKFGTLNIEKPSLKL
jgi:hypothetical protein